jgi:hypothetical protein
MKRWEYTFFHICNLSVIVTGIIYGWMLYCMQPGSEFAVVNHPWHPHLQHAHILAAPLLVFSLGYFWSRHVWKNWNSDTRRGRRSGGKMLWAGLPMIISAYCIQVSVSDGWRKTWIVLHVAVSLLWTAAYVVHWIRHRQAGEKDTLVRS